jgi:FMN phosphatase YigB (HAD superfamily)
LSVVVFDFDGTLINGDSIRMYYHYCVKKNPLKIFQLGLVYVLIVLSKLQFISVRKEKELALLFFFHGSYSTFSKHLKSYVDLLRQELNAIYDTEFQDAQASNQVIIASASFMEILKPLFPKATILSTTIQRQGDKILGIADHPYGSDKRDLLRSLGVNTIDRFYTDSRSDEPTSLISTKTYWVANSRIQSVTS